MQLFIYTMAKSTSFLTSSSRGAGRWGGGAAVGSVGAGSEAFSTTFLRNQSGSFTSRICIERKQFGRSDTNVPRHTEKKGVTKFPVRLVP